MVLRDFNLPDDFRVIGVGMFARHFVGVFDFYEVKSVGTKVLLSLYGPVIPSIP